MNTDSSFGSENTPKDNKPLRLAFFFYENGNDDYPYKHDHSDFYYHEFIVLPQEDKKYDFPNVIDKEGTIILESNEHFKVRINELTTGKNEFLSTNLNDYNEHGNTYNHRNYTQFNIYNHHDHPITIKSFVYYGEKKVPILKKYCSVQ